MAAQRTRKKPRQAGRPVGRAAPSSFGGFKNRISPTSVATFAADAGFRNDREAEDIKGHSELAVAVAIAYAESRFYADAVNRSANGVAYGLWQIFLTNPPS